MPVVLRCWRFGTAPLSPSGPAVATVAQAVGQRPAEPHQNSGMVGTWRCMRGNAAIHHLIAAGIPEDALVHGQERVGGEVDPNGRWLAYDATLADFLCALHHPIDDCARLA